MLSFLVYGFFVDLILGVVEEGARHEPFLAGTCSQVAIMMTLQC